MTYAERDTGVTNMTETQDPPADERTSQGEAAEAAGRAAAASGITVREVTELPGLRDVYRLYDSIWRPDPTNPPVTTEMLRALSKGNNYVAGAFDGDQLLGACVGFFSAPVDQSLHSHVAGVSPSAHGRSVGFALKLHQRAWAIQRGARAISWTYDPLVARNAHFNLVKLSATAVEYLPNFYGGMHDGINGSDESDRLLVRWDLESPRVAAACRRGPLPRHGAAEAARGAVTALARDGDGRPRLGSLDGDVLLVALPRDVETLRRNSPRDALAWRMAVREVLGALLAEGARLTGFQKDVGYVVVRGTAGKDAP